MHRRLFYPLVSFDDWRRGKQKGRPDLAPLPCLRIFALPAIATAATPASLAATITAAATAKTTAGAPLLWARFIDGQCPATEIAAV